MESGQHIMKMENKLKASIKMVKKTGNGQAGGTMISPKKKCKEPTKKVKW